MKYDLIVIGSGPAGMNAAIKAAENGATVALLDEQSIAGGKLLGQLYEEPTTGWWIGKEIAQELAAKVKKLGITYFSETEVWGIFPHWKVLVNKGIELQADYIILATGAAEKAIPIPGWTIPGVMAIGAAQVLTNYYRVKPGKKVAIIGVDPLSLTVAQELQMAGIEVIGIFLPPKNAFTKDQSNPQRTLAYLSSMANVAPNKFLKFAGNMMQKTAMQKVGAKAYPRNGVKVWGIPLFLRKTVVEIEGADQVTRIKVAPITADGVIDKKRLSTLEVDCVCLSGGLYPLSELAGAAQCDFAYIAELGGHVPLHGPEMETTQPGIFVAGNITGIESAKVALAQGELAGAVICTRLGLLKGEPHTLIKTAQEKVKIARKNSLIKFQPNIEVGREKLHQLWIEQRK